MNEKTVEGFRLSPQQLRVWQLQEQDGAAAYRTRGVIRIEPAADPRRLRGAIEEIARRHEILRTTFRRLPGMSAPLQVIGERPPLRFEPEGVAGAFDLADGPVWSVSLPEPSESEEAGSVIVDLSALCADRHTLERIGVELAALYKAKTEGRPIVLGDAYQYADLSEWWNELLEKPDSAAGIDYWRRLDVGAASDQRLPFERSRTTSEGFRPVRTTRALDSALEQRLAQLAAELEAPLPTLLLTCWQVLLQRLLGQSPLLIGYATSGRRLEQLQSALGLCSRTLPLRTSFDDDPPFREAVLRAAARLDEQEKWEDLFTWGLQRMDRTGSAGSLPELGYVFEFEKRIVVSEAGARAFTLEDVRAVTDRFALRLTARQEEQGLALALDFDASRISPEDAERLLARFSRTIEGALTDPSRRVGTIDVLAAAERRRLIVECNDTRRRFQDGGSVLDRFEEAAAQRPSSVALTGGGRRLTLGEVNAAANRIGHTLREAGVGPDVLVGLGLERSIDMIVGLLAIWKAGGAYVPLDPGLPAERLAFLMEDTAARFLLTRRSLAPKFSAPDARVFDIDDPTARSTENPERTAGPQNLAYVIFTSGSTGRPKGVSIEHRQITNYVDAILERLEAPPGASFATVTTLAADLGNTSIFPALSIGGRLHVVSEETSSDPEALAEEFSREPVDYLKIVPSHLSALLSSTRPASILPRRCLVLGGEASTGDLVARVRSLSPDRMIINHYGPTEATIGATTFRVPPDFPAGPGQAVPIGRPLANCRVYIFDSGGALAPFGSPGELHIAGEGLARGYWNRPVLTAERFVERDLGGVKERLYRTGDLARYRDDFEIEILGRTDDQVKLHGFRIEPAEIEAAMREHVDVASAVVLPREVPGTGRRLIGWFVPRSGVKIAASDLRRFLAAKLPDYMVPSSFVPLLRVPLTSNGKIDRAALPLPDPSREEDGGPLVSPRTPQETTLAAIWADVLRIDRFGVHDNFFELGGDSILAIQIIARAAREGLRLTPRQLFEHQTVAELAAVAMVSGPLGGDQGLVTGAVPLTPIQHWFFDLDLLDPHHFNQSVLLESLDPLAPADVQAALDRLARHHDALRLRFVREGSRWRQIEGTPNRDWPLTVVDLQTVPERDRAGEAERAASEAQSSLDLRNGPLARAVLFESGVGHPPRLLLAVHHLAVDSVSWRVLLEDFEVAHRAIVTGVPLVLPPKTTSFQRWAQALTDAAGSESLERESGYWLSRFEDWKPRFTPESLRENTISSARVVESELSEDDTLALLQEVPAAFRARIQDALLAALSLAVADVWGTRSVAIDLEGHGREDFLPGQDLTRTVGWFTARYPVVLHLSDSDEPAEAVFSVREQLRSIPQRGVGYGVLRYLSEGRLAERWKALSEPDISFNYLGQTDSILPSSSRLRLLPSIGGSRSLRNRRSHAISVEGKISSGRLRLTWIYGHGANLQEEVERLAAAFEAELRSIAAACRSGVTRPYVASDFPRAGLKEKDLAKLLAVIADPGSRR